MCEEPSHLFFGVRGCMPIVNSKECEGLNSFLQSTFFKAALKNISKGCAMEAKNASVNPIHKKKGRKITRVVLFVTGTVCLVFGLIGIVLPILPTTPFLLAAAACYYKSSPAMHSWLLNNRWFGEYLRNYKEGRGISLRAKLVVMTLLWLTIMYSVFFVLNVLVAQIALLIIAIAVSAHVITLPTFKKNN